MFDFIYFDTQPLIRAGWPKLSAPLQNMLRLADALGCRPVLPVPVEVELEKHCLRQFREAIERINKSLKEVGELLGKQAVNPTLPDEGAFLDAHRGCVEAFKKQYGVETAPVASCSVTELYDMATSQEAPFKKEKEGAGFQDAVIYLTVIEHAAKSTAKSAAFVSKDSIYKTGAGELLAMAKKRGASLELFETVEDIMQSLSKFLKEAYLERWQEDQRAAEKALKTCLPQVEQFLAANLVVGEYDYDPTVSITALNKITVLALRNVFTSLFKDLKQGEPITISFDADCQFDLTVEEFGFWRNLPEPRAFKVGGREPSRMVPLAPLLQAAFTAQSGAGRQMRRPVEIVASAEQADYQKITFVSARYK